MRSHRGMNQDRDLKRLIMQPCYLLHQRWLMSDAAVLAQ